MTVIAVLVGSLAIIVGITPFLSGWIAPWLHGKVIHPRLWGVGFSLLGANVLVFGIWRHGLQSGILSGVRIAALFATLLLLWLGTRRSVRS